MKTIYLIILVLLVFDSIGQVELTKTQKLIAPYPDSYKKLDIPFYEEIASTKVPFVYWHFTKQKEKQLGLRHPETDSTATIFRLWITNPYMKNNQPHALLEILNDSIGWRGKLILMYVNIRSKKLTETITQSKVIELQPAESDWKIIMDSLVYYKITELPTDEKIPNYYNDAEKYNNTKTTFCFEYSTPDSYRFFQYNDIWRIIEKFQEPQDVEHILDLLERNFSWDKTARKYFRSN